MKVVLTGAKGQLGRCMQDIIPADWQCLALGSEDLDIGDRESVLKIIEIEKPDLIINAAAYTAVDKAETDPVNAIRVNTHGPENLALAAKNFNAKLIHVSTDYVFDGEGTSPYTEKDPVNPLGVYGKSKLAGELLALSILPDTIIIRTAWVFSEYGNNFLKTMIRLGKDRSELSIVADQSGCPTYAGDIASVIIAMVLQNASGGVYHYCGDNEVSWAEFANEIFEEAKHQNILRVAPFVNFISTEQYPTPAKRPKYSSLSNNLIAEFFPASNWRRALKIVISRL